MSEPREEDYVLKVGILGPFSGPSSRTGDELHASATMAFEEIGWQIGAYTIEPVWIDSQSDPAQAALAYEEAIVQDGIEAGILNWHSSVSVSCMELTAQYQVPHLFGLGGTGVVNEVFQSDPDYYGYWMLKGWPEPQKLNIAYVQALEDAIDQGIWSPEAKTVAIGGEDTDWGRDFGAAIAEQFDAAGWEILAEEYLPVDQTYFYPLLYDLVDLNPAVVAGSSTSVSAMMSFINQADEVGLESLLIVDGLGWMGEWYELTGESSDYILDQAPGWPTAEAEEFAVDFEERWGFTPSPAAAGLAYDGSRFFIAVAQAAYQEYDVLTSESIYTFVKENVWTGEWTYTEGIMMESYAATPETVPDPVVGNGYYILPVLQYFDGEGVVIYPPEWAEQELTPPGEVLSSDP